MDADEQNNEGGTGLDAVRATRYISMIKDPAERERFKGVANRYIKNSSQKRTLLSGGKAPQKPALAASDMQVLLAVAALLDVTDMLANLLPGLGGLIAGLALSGPGALTLWFMYKSKGIEMKSSKSIFRFTLATFISVIPIINILPAHITNVILVTGQSKLEEIEGHIV